MTSYFCQNPGKMNFFLKVYFFFAIFCHVRANDGQYSLDAQMGRRYQFELFENFEGCAEVYKQEAKVVDKLVKIKTKLFAIQDQITKLKVETIDKMKELKQMVEDGRNFQKQDKQDIANLVTEFPRMIDFVGSIKAMFILHYSYGLNMSLAVQEGKLTYLNHFNELREHQVHNIALFQKRKHSDTFNDNLHFSHMKN